MNLKKVGEVYKVFSDAIDGDLRARVKLSESLTTSDFPQLLGSALNRKLQGKYKEQNPVWKQYADEATVPNFNEQGLVSFQTVTRGLPLVPEATEYPATSLKESSAKFRVFKYGERLGITYEMVVNDQLGAWRRIDEILAAKAVDHESMLTAKALLKADMTDVNTDVFKDAFKPVESKELSYDNLAEAFQVLNTRTTLAGVPLARPEMVLVVPPQLEMTALALANATEVEVTDKGKKYKQGNPLRGLFTVVVDPALSLSKHAQAAKTWFLLPKPGTVNPAIVTAFLAGHRAPELRYKADAGNRPGGGAIDPREGSFDDDTVQYRVRHIVGAAVVDPTFTYVARGA